jgi:hypothetical protein
LPGTNILAHYESSLIQDKESFITLVPERKRFGFFLQFERLVVGEAGIDNKEILVAELIS